jgi:hypothetical protein
MNKWHTCLKGHIRNIIYVAPLTLITLQPASAEDRNQVIMKTIYFAGLVLAAPGFILGQNIDYNTLLGRATIFRVVDRGIQANWILRFSSYTTSGLYDHILNDKDAAPIPLSDADKSKLAKAKSILYKDGVEGEYTDKYTRYDKLQSAYYTAQDTYTGQVNTSEGHNPTATQSLALQKAYNA